MTGVEDNENYNNYLIEFLLIKPEGQAYIKDFKFDNFPNSEYTIAVSIKEEICVFLLYVYFFTYSFFSVFYNSHSAYYDEYHS